MLREIVAAWGAHLEAEMMYEDGRVQLDDANAAFERMRLAIKSASDKCGPQESGKPE